MVRSCAPPRGATACWCSTVRADAQANRTQLVWPFMSHWLARCARAGNARLRARLNANAAAIESVSCCHIVGRGRQLWTGAGEGGVALWERESASSGASDLSWSYHCTRRLPSPPLLALRPAATNVWGACADGTLCVWLAEAAVADANDTISKRSFLGEAGGSQASASAVQRSVAVPLLKLLRVALDELRRARDDYSSLLGQVNAAWAQIEGDRQQLAQQQDKLAVALNVETIARIDADERRGALVKEVESLQYELSHLGQSRDQALALKAARESEVGRLKKAESQLAQRLKKEEEVGRQLAETRVQLEKLRSERDRAHNEMRAAKRELLELHKAEKAEKQALTGERDALVAGLEQRSMETSSLTEALRAREASEAAARAETAQLRTALQNHEEEAARMKHEREQMRAANARMQALLERLRAKMGQHAGLAHAALGEPEHLAPEAQHDFFSYDGELEAHEQPPSRQPPSRQPPSRQPPSRQPPSRQPALPQAPPYAPRGCAQPHVQHGGGAAPDHPCGPSAFPSSPRQSVLPPPPSEAWAAPTLQPQSARRMSAAAGGARSGCGSVQFAPSSCSSSRRRPGSTRQPDASSGSRLLKPTVSSTLASTAPRGPAMPAECTPSTAAGAGEGRGVAVRTAGGAGVGCPPTARQPAFDVTTPRARAGGADRGGAEQQPERRSASLLLQLASLRSWLELVLGPEHVAPGDLPAVLADGTILCSLVDIAMPGFAAPLVSAAPAKRLEAFATAARQLGVADEDLLQAEALLGPHRSAEAAARALAAFAQAAAARSLLPPLSNV
jgi:hypothetical protein